MRLIKRYVCFSLLVISLVALYFVARDEGEMEMPPNFKRPSPTLNVTIDYFQQFYHSILNPVEGSPGMNGTGVVNLQDEKFHEIQGFHDHGFNELASSKISLERSIPDNRPSACFKVRYPNILPTASVVVIFYNEAWSTLLRTVHTVLARSPPQMLNEIILVDDGSLKNGSYVHLGDQLDNYIKTLRKVKLIRSPNRIGLTQARLIGAAHAQGDVLVFLDSHCETNDGWLEPLLARIVEQPKMAVTPVIEVIKWQDFEYKRQLVDILPNRGIFSWDLVFHWGPVPRNERELRKSDADPIRTPTMAGGLFAIDRLYFFQSGSYDEALKFWGGENVEMSFRLWMCGGGIETLPCSRVGHVFRKRFPYKLPAGSSEHNTIRVAEVWMDEFKDIYYDYRPKSKPYMGGDVSQRQQLREQLQCKSFSWYLQNIIPELEVPERYPQGKGYLRNLGVGSCLDVLSKKSIGVVPGLQPCHFAGGNQFFILTTKGEIWHDSRCLDFSGKKKTKVKMWPCHKRGGNQGWKYLSGEGMLQHALHGTCLGVQGGDLVMKPCDKGDHFQIWWFKEHPADHVQPGEKRTWF